MNLAARNYLYSLSLTVSFETSIVTSVQFLTLPGLREAFDIWKIDLLQWVFLLF